MKTFLILWSTQSLSQLGSAMTNFALTLWLYEKTGSALQTAALSICSYAPYVLMSIFAGALSDRWDKKKVMLCCDTFAACCSAAVLVLLKTESLRPVHMYILNAVNGLMNTVQQPAGEVAMTLITPKTHYQKASGLKSFSNSLVTILHPVFATTMFAFAGMAGVIYIDLGTFAAAFLALLLFVRIPDVNARAAAAEGEDRSENVSGQPEKEDYAAGRNCLNAEPAAGGENAADAGENDESRKAARIDDRKPEEAPGQESLWASAKAGLLYLRGHGLILTLFLFMAGVNLSASVFDAALPPYVLSNPRGGETVLGIVTSCAGIATLLGSLAVTALPAPKNRIRVIWLTMLFSLCAETFLLAFARTPALWCIAQAIGWFPVPFMSANLDVILRSTIPPEMQGRVYSCRNTLQFFTIPVGLFLGGFMVDKICEPFMTAADPNGFFAAMFGSGKGSGAAMTMFLLCIGSAVICLVFGRVLSRYHFTEP